MLLTIFLAIIFCAAITIMLLAAVAFIQDKKFFSSAPKEAQERMLKTYPQILEMWDEKYGDRMIKLVFIGKNMDREALELRLDACLGE